MKPTGKARENLFLLFSQILTNVENNTQTSLNTNVCEFLQAFVSFGKRVNKLKPVLMYSAISWVERFFACMQSRTSIKTCAFFKWKKEKEHLSNTL